MDMNTEDGIIDIIVVFIKKFKSFTFTGRSIDIICKEVMMRKQHWYLK